MSAYNRSYDNLKQGFKPCRTFGKAARIAAMLDLRKGCEHRDRTHLVESIESPGNLNKKDFTL